MSEMTSFKNTTRRENVHRKRSRKRKKKPTSDMGLRKKKLILDNEKDDEQLAKLEKNLKLTKKSALQSKAFCDDGLDYLLETCDMVLSKSKSPKITHKKGTISIAKDQESENELETMKHKRKKSKVTKADDHSTSDTNSWTVSELCEEEIASKDPKRKCKSVKLNEEVEENDALQNQKLEESVTEHQLNLKRQVKGLLNRLTEANMHKIVSQLEGIYSSNVRNSVNKMLVETLMASVGSSVRAPERLIQESAMLVAILHGIVDMSVGVIMAHTCMKDIHNLFMNNSDDECKKLDNLTLFIAHLFNFKVIDDVLIYDYLNLLTERFSEKDIELILSLLRTVGISLRRSNSLQLKDLIIKLQKKASEVKELDSSFRVKYMLEVVLAIKNNNMQKIPNYDPYHVEHLKKLMKGFLPTGISLTQIKIPLEEMLKAEEHGVLLKNLNSGNVLDFKSEINDIKSENPQMDTISKLMKKHRMNTDVRKQIFSIITTAEDYLDAFEKLVQLNVKEQRSDEVMNLILHCALQGKIYNPFYHFLACKLCTTN
ncbi:hypothetical protein J437_LFUL008256, partial [Ladona fulva]